MSIKYKIFLGFSAGAFIFIISSIFSFFSSKEVEKILEKSPHLFEIGKQMLAIEKIASEALRFNSMERLKDTKVHIEKILSASEELKSIGFDTSTFEEALEEHIANLGSAISSGNVDFEKIAQSSKTLDESFATFVSNFYRRAVNISKRSSLLNIVSSVLAFVVVSLFAFMFGRSIVKGIIWVTNFLKELAKGGGDLTKRIEVKGKDEIAELSRAFNMFLDSLAKIVGVLVHASQGLVGNVKSLNAILSEVFGNFEKQTSLISNISTSTEELEATSREISRNAGSVMDFQKNVEVQSKKGKENVLTGLGKFEGIAASFRMIANVMLQISERMGAIEQVLDVIEDVADQTNLLALNAAIESARAGEAGRGFAVVADEVRKLAVRTSEESGNIRKLINEFKADVDKLMEMVSGFDQQLGDSLKSIKDVVEITDQIVGLVVRSTELISSISSAINQQASNIRDSAKAIGGLVQESEKSKQSMDYMRSEFIKILKLAEELKNLTENFKLS